jgi:hypothetical protein
MSIGEESVNRNRDKRVKEMDYIVVTSRPFVLYWVDPRLGYFTKTSK